MVNFIITCLLLCSTKRPTSGLASDLVRNITTHKSNCDRCDFSEFRCPSWNSVNSASVGSNTVSNTHDNEHSGLHVPCKRTSFQPDRTLHISIQSKYLEQRRNFHFKYVKSSNFVEQLTLKHPQMISRIRLQSRHAALKYHVIHQSIALIRPTSRHATNNGPTDFCTQKMNIIFFVLRNLAPSKQYANLSFSRR